MEHRRMRFAVLLVLLFAAYPAAAASFDCAKPASPTERAICGDAKLSALDEREVAAYTTAVSNFGVADSTDFKNPIVDALLRGYQDWTAQRNRCGTDTNCLLTQYLRRIAVLTYHPDPQAPSPLDSLIGRYAIAVDPARELVVMRGPGDTALVHIGVNSADWNCDFAGIGRLERGGKLRVVRADFDGSMGGDHAVLLTPTRTGMSVANARAGDDVSARFCTGGGSFDQPYPRADLVQ
jgi:uncharacterized protein